MADRDDTHEPDPHDHETFIAEVVDDAAELEQRVDDGREEPRAPEFVLVQSRDLVVASRGCLALVLMTLLLFLIVCVFLISRIVD